MWYDYRCPVGHLFERELPVRLRDSVQTCSCGQMARRDAGGYHSLTIAIPKRLHTAFSDIHGIPGSPQREQFEREVRDGTTEYAGPGSRWI